MKKKIAVILAGCGAKDGSEIQEATLTLYAVSSEGAEYEIFAPARDQHDVIDHLTDETVREKRNILAEAARIARGDIRPVEDLREADFDALILPGGFGAAKNLFTYAYEGIGFRVYPEVEKAVRAFHEAGKPVGAICIAPVMIAKLFGGEGVEITVGPAAELGEELERAFGAKATQAEPDGIVIDRKNRIVTTPAYMYGDNTIANVGHGIARLVKKILEMA